MYKTRIGKEPRDITQKIRTSGVIKLLGFVLDMIIDVELLDILISIFFLIAFLLQPFLFG
jgi:hypothetical protein